MPSADTKSIENYRPISILPAFSKIIEKIACDSLRKYFLEKQIITESQFGFMENRCTEDALLSFTGDILDAFDRNFFTIGVFLDFSKAFDTVNHHILLSKLDHYGIRHKAYDWLSPYLSNRQQYFDYSGKQSNLSPINCGVPQGSILGPLLFVIYINDIIYSSQHLKFVLFADDSNLYASHDDLPSLIALVNRELELVRQWVVANKLTLNLKKTHYMVFHRRSVLTHDQPLMIGNSALERVVSTEFLGVILHESLKWDNHIQRVTDKIAKLCGILYLSRNQLTVSALRQIYFSLVYPNIIAWLSGERLGNLDLNKYLMFKKESSE